MQAMIFTVLPHFSHRSISDLSISMAKVSMAKARFNRGAHVIEYAWLAGQPTCACSSAGFVGTTYSRNRLLGEKTP